MKPKNFFRRYEFRQERQRAPEISIILPNLRVLSAGMFFIDLNLSRFEEKPTP
jgi:hypothetical protein